MAAFLDDFNAVTFSDCTDSKLLTLDNFEKIAREKRHICPRSFFGAISSLLCLNDTASPYLTEKTFKKKSALYIDEPYNSKLKKIVQDFSADEKDALFFGTASRVYSL